MELEFRIRALPAAFRKQIDLLNSKDFVGCLYQIVQTGEEFSYLQEQQNLTINQLKSESLELQNQNDLHALQLEQEKKKAEELTQEKQQILEKLEGKEKELANTKAEYDEMSSCINYLNEQLEDLKQSAENDRELLIQTQTENTNLQQSLLQLYTENSLLKQELESTLAEKSRTEAHFAEAKEVLRYSQEELLKSVDGQEVDNIKAQLESLKQAIQAMQPPSTELPKQTESGDDKCVYTSYYEKEHTDYPLSKNDLKYYFGKDLSQKISKSLRISKASSREYKYSALYKQNFESITFGDIENIEDSSPQHLIYLLLNQNYNLSNLLNQQFQTVGKQEFYNIFKKMNTLDQTRLNKQLMTELENLRDIFVEQKFITQSFDYFYSKLLLLKYYNQSESNAQLTNEINKLRFQLDLCQKKIQMFNMTAAGPEDIVSNKYALSTVYYQSLCQYLEYLLDAGVEEHFSYLTSCQNQIIAQTSASRYPQGTESGKYTERQISILKQILDDKLTYQQLKKNMQAMSLLAPAKVKLISSKFDSELQQILKYFILNLNTDEKKITQLKTEQTIDNAYLASQNSQLSALVLSLFEEQASENNKTNLNDLLLVLQADNKYLMDYLVERNAKVAQLTNLVSKLTDASDNTLKLLADKFSVLQTSLDTGKINKLQYIIEKQQKIINDQQADLKEMCSVQYENADCQVNTIQTQIDDQVQRRVEAERAMDEVQNYLDRVQRMNKADIDELYLKYSKLQYLNDWHVQYLRDIAELIGQLPPPDSVIEARLSVIENKIAQSNTKLQGLGRIFMKQKMVIAKYNQILKEKLYPQNDDFMQTELSAFACDDKYTQMEQVVFYDSGMYAGVSVAEKSIDAEYPCSECKRLIQLCVIQKAENEKAEKDLENLNALLNKLDSKQYLQKSSLKKAEQAQVKASNKTIQLQKYLETYTQARQLAEQQRDEYLNDNKKLADEFQRAKAQLADLASKNKDKLKIIKEQSEKIKETEELRQSLASAKGQNAKLYSELRQSKQLLREAMEVQEKYREQLVKQIKDIQKLKKKPIRPEDREKMSSLLSQDDLDAIFS